MWRIDIHLYESMRMRKEYGLIWIVVVILSCTLSQDIIAAEDMPLTEAGSYYRKNFFVKLYHVKFETIESSKLVDKFLAKKDHTIDPKYIHDALGEFILDPRNRFPVRLTFTILQNKKNYSKESKFTLQTLARAGLEVDESWQLKNNESHQADVTLFVKSVLGPKKSKLGDFYAQRRKGDVLLYIVDSNDHAFIEYRPGPQNKNARPGKVQFSSSQLLRGVIETYLCVRRCSDELKGQLPQAMLKNIVDAYKNRTGKSILRK
jgi:hypothetical protein